MYRTLCWILLLPIALTGCLTEKKTLENHPAQAHADGSELRQPINPMQADKVKTAAGSVIYTCPMHPEVRESKPGKCPLCGMDLIEAPSEEKGATHDGMQH